MNILIKSKMMLLTKRRSNDLFLLVDAIFANKVCGQLEIVNVRVGQGDATIIQGPVVNNQRVNILVDGGNISNRDGGNILRTVLNKRGIKHLDYVIVSHYDADHIGGIVSGTRHGVSLLLGFNGEPGGSGDDDNDGVVNWGGENNWEPDPEEFGTDDDISVGNFVDRGDVSPSTSQAYKKYKLMAEAQNNRISLNDRNDVEGFEIDLGDGAQMIALAANGFVRDRATRVARVNTPNERSLSFLVKYNEFDYLISGDLIGRRSGAENAFVEKAVGQYIDSKGYIIDVLHVNHHGANNASEEDFLSLIKPTIAIISAGNGNDYRHPTNGTLNRLEEAKVYRIIQTSWGTTKAKVPNDVRKIHSIYQGDIVITCTRDDYEISTQRRFKFDKNPRRN